MSIHLPASVLAPILRTESSVVDDSDSDSTDNDSQDNNFDGWDDPALDSQPCHSLFCCTDTADGDMSASDTRRADEIFTDARAALAHDREAHGFHFEAVCARMGEGTLRWLLTVGCVHRRSTRLISRYFLLLHSFTRWGDSAISLAACMTRMRSRLVHDFC
ncbi:hypothetical protein BJ138DRAFT_101122 [Hygrophoropsis aurantiaca]|uniref:Uncharacterized protein n=1 Tax=Hygrophoropsis aurantiaca TaxID=72124 RepID=A0ACB8ACI2_9AGAM|nr:hypothetical protein BJ138DRAFT_101122 [Hygrophoropsis aurantiaca]